MKQERCILMNDKEYNYKILVYPNITYQKDLEKDSYIVVIRNVIKVLNQLRDDLFFTLILPCNLKSLDYLNVEQLILPVPSHPNAMRSHFNFPEIYKLISWRDNDYDILYSHLPEHTTQLVNMFYNTTNIRPKVIGYCHWYEVPENVSFAKTFFKQNIIGTLEMEECGVNSQWLKNFVISRARGIFNEDIIGSLKKKIQPHYLGVDLIDRGDTVADKTILFNHRSDLYTGWNWFIKCMDVLWVKRKDFIVNTTLANIDRPYIKKVSISDRNEYLNFVKSRYIGVACFDKYSAWSISTTDGLSMGVPYVLPKRLCYPEMVGNDYPLLYNTESEFIELIEKLLDNKGFRNSCVLDFSSMKWENTVSKWFSNWNIFDSSSYSIPKNWKTGVGNEIINYIHSKGFVLKKDIVKWRKWGASIPFSPYRNLLRQIDDIVLTKDGYLSKKSMIGRYF